jgi:hypothetical protein
LREELGVTARIRNVGEFRMTDEISQKFVGVFIGTLRQRPVIVDDLIAELIYMSPAQIDTLLREDSSLFTPTFVSVYEHFRRSEQSR